MSLITFQDLPNTTTPINSSNLNNNFSELSEVVLYNNANGTNGDITLSETSANFKYIEIYYTTDEQYRFERVYNPNGKTVMLVTQTLSPETPRIYGKTKKISISGTALTVVNYCQYVMNNNSMGYLQTSSDRNLIYIVRVVGYK